MLYLNKELFKPALIVLSGAFGFLFVLFLILMLVIFHWILLLAFFIISIAYGILLLLAWKLSKSKKYYLASGKGFLEIHYPTVNYGRGKLRVPFKAILSFEYYPIKSWESWKTFVSYGSLPECVYITYVTQNGRKNTELIGYVTYEEIKAIADQLGVETKIM